MTKDELPEPIREYLACLYSTNGNWSSMAVECLVEKDKMSLPALLMTLQQPEWMAHELLRLAPHSMPLIRTAPQNVRQARGLAAEALSRIGSAAVPGLIEAHKIPDAAVREAVVRALREIADEQALAALRGLIYEEIHRARKERNWWLLRTGSRYLAITLFLIWLASTFRLWDYSWLMMMFGWGGASFVDRGKSVRTQAVSALTESDDPRMIGILAFCLTDRDYSVRGIARNALIKLLPQVKASDRSAITVQEMNALLRQLTEMKDQRLCIAILKALEQIGDERALTTVMSLAEDEEMQFLHPGWTEVFRAAQECLPYLKTRIEQAREAQTLLRPSSAVEAIEPAQLLRPAQGVGTANPAEMLRPAAESQALQEGQVL